MATDLERQVLKALGLTSKDAVKDPTGAHQSFLASRRVTELILNHGDWATDPALTSLTARLKNEIAAVNAYLATTLATRQAPGRLGGPKDLDAPAHNIDPSQEYAAQPGFHLDLGDVAFTKDTTKSEKAKQNTSNLVDGRRARVRTIAWRAAAIHANLWQDADPTGIKATLATPAGSELAALATRPGWQPVGVARVPRSFERRARAAREGGGVVGGHEDDVG